ncbi:MAG: hypothetical protein Aurels2KO_35630 [Aureliella sp.]
MQLPIKAHYAALAMLALARSHSAGQLVPARAIAEEQKIPSQFLGQILQQLRSSGLITSTRGSSGGFQLSKLPEAITLAEIVESVCPTCNRPPDLGSQGTLGEVLADVWDQLHHSQHNLLAEVTLAELLTRANSENSTMFYI